MPNYDASLSQNAGQPSLGIRAPGYQEAGVATVAMDALQELPLNTFIEADLLQAHHIH